MLKLVGITKQYTLGGSTIDALRGVDLEFRENERWMQYGQRMV